MSLLNLARAICPPVLARLLERRRQLRNDTISFTGDYSSWDEAVRASQGYSAGEILAKTRTAMHKVIAGAAAYERDSVLFDEVRYEFPLLAGLLRAAVANDGRLSVLDFGGALGSTYFQCKAFLSVVKDLRWSVVEQPAHVASGQTEFSTDQLHFYLTVDECLRSEQPNVLLLSSVVQYLPAPYDFVAEILARGFPCVLVDRTPFMRDGSTRLTVQYVPAWIYKASYPAWFLGEARFLEMFAAKYRLVMSFPALDNNQPDGGSAECKGFLFELK